MRPSRLRRIGRRFTATCGLVALTLAVSASGASARSLGPLAGQLSAFKIATSTGAPSVVAWENFNGANNTPLNGTVTDGGGKTWSVNPAGGNWRIQANMARPPNANTALLIDGGAANRTAAATVLRNGSNNFDVGLTINRNTTGTQFLTAEWTSTGNGTLMLQKYNSGFTTLASVTNLYPGGIGTAPASIVLSLSSTSANVLSASINGVPVLSTTLSAGDVAIYKNATHQLLGLYRGTTGNATPRWDDFHVDNP
jgi:hypothetical protein